MKRYYVGVLLFAMAVCSAVGQENSLQIEEAVRISLFDGVSEGPRIKEIKRAGDAAAVAITEVVADKPLSANQKLAIPDILSQAFSRPEWILANGDQEPRTALFLLNALENSSSDTALNKKIASIRRTIQPRQ